MQFQINLAHRHLLIETVPYPLSQIFCDPPPLHYRESVFPNLQHVQCKLPQVILTVNGPGKDSQ